MRLDQYLVLRGLAPTRTKAKELIESGVVTLKSSEGGTARTITTPAYKVKPTDTVGMEDSELLKYASRAGLKLEGALKHLQLEPAHWQVLDVGISTGGFADCLIQLGAQHVIGVDVGHDQLAPRLKRESRITAFDGVNARELTSFSPLSDMKNQFDLVVADVSFISLTQVLAELVVYIKPSGHLLALVKPQFEVGRENIGKGGVVKEASLYSQIEDTMKSSCASLGLHVLDYFESTLPGRDGNQEFFIYAKK